MTHKLDPFQLPALEQLSKIIDVHSGTEITDLFRKAGIEGISHDGSTKWRFLYRTFEELQKKHGAHEILKFLQTVCNPQEYFDNPNMHRHILDQINDVLSFYGIKINDKGIATLSEEKIETIPKRESEDAQLFHKRSYHSEIVKHAREQFKHGHYFDAVDECCKAFTKYVSEKSQLDKHGVDLMSSALSPKGPLKLNAQKTETERNEQEGLMHMCMGLMKSIRNTVEHEPQLERKISRDDALDILSWVSFLYKQIDKTTYFKTC
jgi:uncharacterized protein (TIGR02391 family)